MFKVGKVINHYEKIAITVVELTGNLTVGDEIKIYKDGQEVLNQKIDKILLNQKSVDFAGPKDVVALTLNDKVQKGSEVFRVGQLGVRS